MKKCNDCECLFHSYENCPSCGSENIANYKPSDEHFKEAKDDILIEQMGAMVEFSPLNDLEIE